LLHDLDDFVSTRVYHWAWTEKLEPYKEKVVESASMVLEGEFKRFATREDNRSIDPNTGKKERRSNFDLAIRIREGANSKGQTVEIHKRVLLSDDWLLHFHSLRESQRAVTLSIGDYISYRSGSMGKILGIFLYQLTSRPRKLWNLRNTGRPREIAWSKHQWDSHTLGILLGLTYSMAHCVDLIARSRNQSLPVSPVVSKYFCEEILKRRRGFERRRLKRLKRGRLKGKIRMSY